MHCHTLAPESSTLKRLVLLALLIAIPSTTLAESLPSQDDVSPALAKLRGQLQHIWSGSSLRPGTTSIYVVDASTGEELYNVHEDAPLNPASNVKLVSTSTVLATLGPNWKYQTRIFGAQPDAEGVVHGGLYLHGSYDPTLGPGAMTSLAQKLSAQGVRKIDGDILLSDDLLRDNLAMGRIRVTVHGQRPGKPPLVETYPATAFVEIGANKARTTKGGRSRVRLQSEVQEADGLAPVMKLTLSGRIRKGHKRVLFAGIKRRSTFTASVMRAALEEVGIEVLGTTRIASFDQFNAEATVAGTLPWPLAVHESQDIATLISRVNKRSLNHLSDRLVMTAASSISGNAPSMNEAVTLMKVWLTSIGIDASSVVLDTGSGLSYQTKISTHQIVRVLRAAAGYLEASESVRAGASSVFRESLSVGGVDGTLRSRFKTSIDGRVVGKTGTLSSVIALSGFLTHDDRTLCFSIVTNNDRRLQKRAVRLGHESLVAKLDDYLEHATTPSIEDGTHN